MHLNKYEPELIIIIIIVTIIIVLVSVTAGSRKDHYQSLYVYHRRCTLHGFLCLKSFSVVHLVRPFVSLRSILFFLVLRSCSSLYFLFHIHDSYECSLKINSHTHTHIHKPKSTISNNQSNPSHSIYNLPLHYRVVAKQISFSSLSYNYYVNNLH